MKTSQGHTLTSLRAVASFLEANTQRLGDVAASGTRTKLDETIVALSSHVTDQVATDIAARGATRKLAGLRTALIRDHMKPIARIARCELPSSPELAPLKCPRGRPTIARLAAAATGMANAAEPFAHVFVGAGLPADFIRRLIIAANTLNDVVNERQQLAGARVGATRGLRTQLSRGRGLVQVLDAFIQSALSDDPATCQNWNIVMRVPRGPRSQPPSAVAP